MVLPHPKWKQTIPQSNAARHALVETMSPSKVKPNKNWLLFTIGLAITDGRESSIPRKTTEALPHRSFASASTKAALGTLAALVQALDILLPGETAGGSLSQLKG